MIRGIPIGALLGAALVLGALWLYRNHTSGKVATPMLDTVIDLNPMLFHYPGVSSVPA